jgi:hypothetical protein
VLQPNVKFASLKEQALFYGEIPEDDPCSAARTNVVPPLDIKLRKGAEPVRVSARKYARPQLNFMGEKMRELEELGFVYKNTGAE